MSTVPTIIEHVRALALAVREGELTPEQREGVVSLLSASAPQPRWRPGPSSTTRTATLQRWAT